MLHAVEDLAVVQPHWAVWAILVCQIGLCWLLTLYLLMATIVAIWPNWGFCRIGKFNTCTSTTLILKNLHHWFVFISDFRTYQVFSGPCISRCIVFNWKALMLIYISSFQLSWAWKSEYNRLIPAWLTNWVTYPILYCPEKVLMGAWNLRTKKRGWALTRRSHLYA